MKEIMTHDLVEILPKPTYVSFGIMESCAETCTEQQTVLYNALRMQQPFSMFRRATCSLGILQNWYDFQKKEELCIAEKWLWVEALEIQNGKVVRSIVDFSE